MEEYYTKIIESVITVVIYILIRVSSFKVINKTLNERLIRTSRGIVIKKSLHIILTVVCLFILIIIWGVNQADLISFVASVLTIIGVAMFAQWSLLSNITSGIILFFNHSVRIGDYIVIMEGKDYVIEGKVIDIGLFFVTIHTEGEEELTLPNNVFIQKSIRKKRG